MDYVVYKIASCDGCEDAQVCDGERHIEVSLDKSLLFKDLPHSSLGPCDGSCKSSDQRPWLVEKVKKVRVSEIHDTEQGNLPSVVELSDQVRELIDGGQPLMGRVIDDWYCKRDSQGKVIVLDDGQILRVTEVFTWWRDPGTATVYLTLKVELVSEHWALSSADSEQTIQRVEAALAMDRQWRARG